MSSMLLPKLPVFSHPLPKYRAGSREKLNFLKASGRAFPSFTKARAGMVTVRKAVGDGFFTKAQVFGQPDPAPDQGGGS